MPSAELIPTTVAQQEFLADHRQQARRTGAQRSLALIQQIDGPLDAGALVAALQQVTQQEPVLQLRFIPGCGDQAMLTAETGWIERFNLLGADGPRATAVARSWVRSVVTTPWPIEQRNPVRWALFSTGAETHVLALAASHLVLDDRGVRLLTERVWRVYADPDGHDGAPAARYRRVLESERAWLSGEEARTAQAQWSDVASRARRSMGPDHFPVQRASTLPGPAAVARYDLRGAELAGLRRRCVDRRRTPAAVILSALADALFDLGVEIESEGRPDAVGLVLPVDTRRGSEAQRVVGMFVQALPLVVDRAGDCEAELDRQLRMMRQAVPRPKPPASSVSPRSGVGRRGTAFVTTVRAFPSLLAVGELRVGAEVVALDSLGAPTPMQPAETCGVKVVQAADELQLQFQSDRIDPQELMMRTLSALRTHFASPVPAAGGQGRGAS